MSQATIAAGSGIRFDVTIKSAVGVRKYFTAAATWFEAWEKASSYCGDVACIITVMPASVQ